MGGVSGRFCSALDAARCSLGAAFDSFCCGLPATLNAARSGFCATLDPVRGSLGAAHDGLLYLADYTG